MVIICEGNSTGTKNKDYDATCYNRIFEDEYPDTKFVSGGNSSDVASDRLGLLAALPSIAAGIKVRRLIDRDDRNENEVSKLRQQGTRVLSRRHIECYLFDDEVLRALCAKLGREGDADDVVQDKTDLLRSSVSRGNPPDDLKSAAGELYNRIKARLSLVARGNDFRAFARDSLAPLIGKGMKTYDDLRDAIFGSLC